MATLWLKESDPNKKDKKYMDKRAAQRFIEKKVDEINELKRQLILALDVKKSMEERMATMTKQEKLLYMVIIAVSLLGIVGWIM